MPRIPKDDRASADYLAAASNQTKGLLTDVIDHDQISRQGVAKVLKFARDDDSGLPPAGASNPAPPLAKPGAIEVDDDLEGEILIPAPTPTPPQPSLPHREVSSEVASPRVTASPPTKAVPLLVVEFVSDIVDLPVPCFEASWIAETRMLALVVPNTTRLKLSVGQSITVRCPAQKGLPEGEGVYWFTGLTIPIKVMEATLLVFGAENKEEA